MRYLALAIDITALIIFSAFIISGIGGLFMLSEYPNESKASLMLTSVSMLGFGAAGIFLAAKNKFR